MAEARLRTISVVTWIVLASAAVALAAVGLSETTDAVGWWVEASIWTIAIAGIALITVPAPSGSRLSLGIGAIVAASILTSEPTAFGTAVAAGLVLSWMLQSRITAFKERSDGDFLGDAVAASIYSVAYWYAADAVEAWEFLADGLSGVLGCGPEVTRREIEK